MKILILSCLLSIASCVPNPQEIPIAQQPKPAIGIDETAKQEITKPENEPMTQAALKVELPAKKIEDVPAKKIGDEIFIRHYQGMLLNEEYSAGVISIHSIDRKRKEVHFSTVFLGVRKEYKLPFKIQPGATPSLKVRTKKFNFQTDGGLLQIDLFEGVVQRQLAEMPVVKPFEYDPSQEVALITIIRDGTSYEKPSRKIANASIEALKSSDLENLKASDLEVMKNAIYARHGAAFRESRMTDYFTENDWYSPLFTMEEVSQKLTKIEVKNINLIGRFEEHAKRYYFKFRR